MDGITQVPQQDGSFLLLYTDGILLYKRIVVEVDFLLLQRDIAAARTMAPAEALTVEHCQMQVDGSIKVKSTCTSVKHLWNSCGES